MNDDRPKVHYLSVHFEDGTDLNIVSSNGETHIWPSPEVVDSAAHIRVAREYRAAPELLAALRLLLDAVFNRFPELADSPEWREWLEGEEDPMAKAVLAADAALARADSSD